jgi:uncharacterized repeat protein (TIGR01451 family)
MSVFNAANPNGVWSLYVDDHSPGDVGAVTNGWSLSVALITPVNQLADLAVTGIASPNPAVAGSPLTYLFTVTNSGPNTASFVVFTNALPPGMSLISASSSQGSAPTASGSVVTANLGPLNVGASAGVTIVAMPGAAAAGTATSIANVASASETDLNPANNTVSVISSVALPLADVGVSQTAAPNPALVGSNVTFTISVTNRGPGLALDLALTNPIPSGALFISATSTVGTATSLGGVVTCQFGNLASSTSAVVTVVYHASSAGLMTNSAILFTDSVDTNLADNTSAYILTIASPAPNILPAGAHLSAESFSPPDGAIESGETVTVSLALTNGGSADTTANFTATLTGLAGIAPGNPTQQTYGVVHPGGAVVSRPFTFTASGGNGATIVASLHLLDGANDLGTVSFPFTLAQHSSFSNLAAIIIPEHGPGNPYPASLAVSSMTGAVSKATVTLSGYGHTYPSDVSFLLVGPSGADAVLSSKTGGPHSITNVNLTFDDSAANGLPLFAQILPGTYHPTSSNSSLAMPSPAPSRPYGSALANLNGSNPNGTWSLYVFDDTPGDGGVIAGGWSLDLTTVSPVNPLADVGLTMSGSPAVLFAGANITNTISLTNFGPSNANGVFVTNGLSAGVNFVSASLSQGAIASSAGGLVVWNVGALAANGGASGIIITAPALAGSAVSTVTVSANESDLNAANNSAQTTATVISPAPIHLSGLVTNRQFQLTVTAEPNLPYSIQASTNLTTWLSLVTTNANAGGTIKYTDTTAPGYQYRYYRAVRLLP